MLISSWTSADPPPSRLSNTQHLQQKEKLLPEALSPSNAAPLGKTSLSSFLSILTASHGLLCPKASAHSKVVQGKASPAGKTTTKPQLFMKSGTELSMNSKGVSTVIIVAKKINRIPRSSRSKTGDYSPGLKSIVKMTHD